MKYFIPLFFLLSLFFSCDIIEPNGNYYIADTVSNTQTDTQDIAVKKVLLLDFTGIRCINCPEAHEIIHQIQNVFPNKIIPVAIHGTSLAYPIGEYEVNLKTDDGNEIFEEFDIDAIPIGLVDNYNKQNLIDRSAWSDAVSSAINNDLTIGIVIQNSFNSSNNNLDISVTITALSDFQNSLKLSVFIVEDSIITRQATTESPGYLIDYIQMNVFRDAVSNVWGDDIFVTGAAVNNNEITDYSYTFSPNWKSKNCRIIAFVFDENKKILNVQETKLN